MEAGLATVTRNGYPIDRFRDRVMFAAHDERLDMVGFVGWGAEQQDLLARGVFRFSSRADGRPGR
jgi:hypothetical protein